MPPFWELRRDISYRHAIPWRERTWWCRLGLHWWDVALMECLECKAQDKLLRREVVMRMRRLRRLRGR